MKAEGLKDEHELQSYFIRRIEKFLSAKDRRLIGWDEILEGGLAPKATVQSWRGMAGAVAAATAGHDVIASPTTHCYLDYAQGLNPAYDTTRDRGLLLGHQRGPHTATRGDLHPATRGDFFMATDSMTPVESYLVGTRAATADGAHEGHTAGGHTPSSASSRPPRY